MTDRERKRALHEKRQAMGLCIRCSGLIDNPEYKTCYACRAKIRDSMAEYRQKTKESEELRRKLQLEELKRRASGVDIPADHKCWTCVWSRFEGDRFFCPFVIGTCIKEGKHED